MGGSGVAHDGGGCWLFGFHSYEGRGNALQEEAVTLRDGLAVPWSRGLRHVMCVVDCGLLLVIMEEEESIHFMPILA